MKDGAELIFDHPLSARAKRFFGPLRDGAPSWVSASKVYTGTRRIVVVYGAGAAARQEYLRRHKEAGGRYVAFDLGYWERLNSLRMALDGLHPTPAHLRIADGVSGRRSFTLREDSDPNGHVLLVGVGVKTAAMWGEHPQEWERCALAYIRAQVPGARIVWRPKGNPAPLDGLPMSVDVPIADALKGASLVVCRASNVAVDACVAGVPVWCDGGAAIALYGDTPTPTREQRLAFLHALSWWEWHRDEAPATWNWIQHAIAATER